MIINVLQPFAQVFFKRQRKKQSLEKKSPHKSTYSLTEEDHGEKSFNATINLSGKRQEFRFTDKLYQKELNETISEGKKEAIKEAIKETDKNEKKIAELVSNSDKILLRIKAVWPFDLFPNEVIIDLNKVNIVYKEFFWSGQIRSSMISKIADVMVDTDLFFATLTIIEEDLPNNYLEIKFLKKDHGIKAKRIIQGLITAYRNNIDLTKIDSNNLTEKIEEIGKAEEAEDIIKNF